MPRAQRVHARGCGEAKNTDSPSRPPRIYSDDLDADPDGVDVFLARPSRKTSTFQTRLLTGTAPPRSGPSSSTMYDAPRRRLPRIPELGDHHFHMQTMPDPWSPAG